MLRHAAPPKPRRGWAGFGVGVGEYISARASHIGWACALAFATPCRTIGPQRREGEHRTGVEPASPTWKWRCSNRLSYRCALAHRGTVVARAKTARSLKGRLTSCYDVTSPTWKRPPGFSMRTGRLAFEGKVTHEARGLTQSYRHLREITRSGMQASLGNALSRHQHSNNQ